MLPLLWVVGAQLVDWVLCAATLALMPQAVTLGFAALTGADTSEPLPVVCPVLLLLVWVVGAPVVVWVACPPALAFTPLTLVFGLPALTGAEMSDPPVGVPLLLLLCWVGAAVVLWVDLPSAVAFTPVTLVLAFPAFTGTAAIAPPLLGCPLV